MEKQNNIDDIQLLHCILNEIMTSNEYTMIVKSMDEVALEYGIIGQKMKKVQFSQVSEEDFWEFVYNGILNESNISPDVQFHTVNGFGNVHSSVTIDLSDHVTVIILNRDHKYDDWIEQLYLKLRQQVQNDCPETLQKIKSKAMKKR